MVTVHTVYDPGDLTERKEQLPYKLYNVVEEPHMTYVSHCPEFIVKLQ